MKQQITDLMLDKRYEEALDFLMTYIKCDISIDATVWAYINMSICATELGFINRSNKYLSEIDSLFANNYSYGDIKSDKPSPSLNILSWFGFAQSLVLARQGEYAQACSWLLTTTLVAEANKDKNLLSAIDELIAQMTESSYNKDVERLERSFNK